MIKRLKYSEIDFEKYSECFANSEQKNFYAQKEILDFLCETWELLVYKDYDYVMPIPIKKKLGLSFVIMPLFCQQLGIFGKDDNKAINNIFLDFLKQNFRIIFYAFNFQNQFSEFLTKKKNYVVESQEYMLLRKKYFKGRKSTVKSAQHLRLQYLRLDESILNYIKTHFKGLKNHRDEKKFLMYLQYLNQRNWLKIYGSYKNDELTNLLILIDFEAQFSVLGLINNEFHRKENGASFLVDAMIKENIAEKSFNFMGGSIRGIEIFFKSFGSELQEYPIIENSRKELLKSIFKF